LSSSLVITQERVIIRKEEDTKARIRRIHQVVVIEQQQEAIAIAIELEKQK
jgi:hypothetical protein